MRTVLPAFIFSIYLILVESVITNGTSGEPCPEKKCLAGKADCFHGKCICREPYRHDADNGNFACYPPSNGFCEIKNDPKVTNFNHETADFPFPCRYLVANIETTLRIGDRNVGFCRCVLHAWNDKHGGKFYVGGFDYSCQIKNNDTNEELGFAMTIGGQANDGQYMYTEYGADKFLPDGPWTTTPVHIIGENITVMSSYDNVNNQARVIIPECGWTITFVAYDIQKKQRQNQIPGLSVAVNYERDPVFFEHNSVITTARVRFGGTTYRDLEGPLLSVTEALLLRGFTSDVVQNKPDDEESLRCSRLSDILKGCSPGGKVMAALGCFWMFQHPRFIRCLDPFNKSSRLFTMLEHCIYYFCGGPVSCVEFVNHVNSTRCRSMDGIPKLALIVGGSFC